MESFPVATRHREQFVEITAEVQRALDRTGIREGLRHVFSSHTTAGLTINENADPDVVSDMLKWFREMIPQDGGFRHGEGNADAHIKTSLVGCFQIVPVTGGQLALGRWQGIYLCEFDGPRTRTVNVTAVGQAGPRT
ncbi:MAG: secondary thiamine-phosphate synthase enzyme YjbQ [Candidatus Sericytochromatia bacterium]